MAVEVDVIRGLPLLYILLRRGVYAPGARGEGGNWARQAESVFGPQFGTCPPVGWNLPAGSWNPGPGGSNPTGAQGEAREAGICFWGARGRWNLGPKGLEPVPGRLEPGPGRLEPAPEAPEASGIWARGALESGPGTLDSGFAKLGFAPACQWRL